jgi:hypothetical protein
VGCNPSRRSSMEWLSSLPFWTTTTVSEGLLRP